MSFKKWSNYILLFTLLFFILVAIFNFIINPYSIFNHNILSKFFIYKNNIVSSRMLVFYNATKEDPNNIMIGSSRIGIFSKSEIEKYLPGKSFNMAMPGSNIEEQVQYLKYMIKNHHIKNIIWGLDFYSFNPDLQNDPDFSYNRLNSSLLFRNDLKVSLFSLQTTKNSIKTLLDNLNKPSNMKIITESDKENMKQQQNKAILKFTKDQISQKTDDLIKLYTKKYFASKKFKNPHSIDTNIYKIKEIITLCKNSNIHLYIYTSPVQEKFLNLYNNLGLNSTFAYWKVELSKITPYTDFCHYSSVTKNIMNFMDGSHIMPNYGKYIFAEIFNNKNVKQQKDFAKHIKQKRI